MKAKVMAVLQDWFDEELGNRVTSNNFQMLANKLGEVIDAEDRKKQLQDGELGAKPAPGPSPPVDRAQPTVVRSRRSVAPSVQGERRVEPDTGGDGNVRKPPKRPGGVGPQVADGTLGRGKARRAPGKVPARKPKESTIN